MKLEIQKIILMVTKSVSQYQQQTKSVNHWLQQHQQIQFQVKDEILCHYET